MSFEFVAVGDLHFEKLNNLPLEDPLAPIFTLLNRVVKYCDEHGIKTIVQLGDVFETPWPKQSSIRRFIEFLHASSHITFHIILGNHDFATTQDNSLEIADSLINGMGLLKNVNLYTKPHLATIGNVNVGFYPFPHCDAPQDGKSRLLFGHFDSKGAKHDNGSTIHTGIDLDVLSPLDFWIMGHLHQYQELGRVVYVGTMAQMNFGETLPKYFLHVKAQQKDSNDLKVKYKPISVKPPYELVNIVVESVDDLEKLQDKSNIFYKLFIKKGVLLPSDLSTRYPNIVKILGYNTANSQKQLEQDKIEIGACERSLSPTYKLDEYLGKFELTNDQKKKAASIVEDIINEQV